MILARLILQILTKIKSLLEKEFKITVSKLKHFVGMEIQRQQRNLLSQTNIDKIHKFNMPNANPVSILADPHTCLIKALLQTYRTEKQLDSCQWPDIAFAVSVVSQYLDNHDDSHCRETYFSIYQRHKISAFSCQAKTIVSYSNADYAGDRNTLNFGLYLHVERKIVTWSSKWQTLSLTTEAEFIAANEATKEAIWLRKLLYDLRVESM